MEKDIANISTVGKDQVPNFILVGNSTDPVNCQLHKMVKHTQTFRQQPAIRLRNKNMNDTQKK